MIKSYNISTFVKGILMKSFINIYEKIEGLFMENISTELERKFEEIHNLIEGASLVNLTRIRERIQSIVDDKNMLHAIRKLEGNTPNEPVRRTNNLMAKITEENENRIKELEAENKALKEQLERASVKSGKKIGRKESLTEQKKKEIRAIYKTGDMSMPRLAKKYKVSVGLIHKIINSQS